MSNIVNDMRTYLISKSAVTALTSTRIYFGNLPQNSKLPAVVMSLIDSDSQKHLTNADGLRRSSIQLDCYGTSTGNAPYASAYNVAEQIRKVVDFNSGTWGSSTVRRALVDDQRDFEDEPGDGSEFSRFGRSVDVTVWHTESLPST